MGTASTASTVGEAGVTAAGTDLPRARERVVGDGPARVLVVATIAVSAAGAVAELGAHALGWPDAWVEALSLGFEVNVPTWYASSLLALCAAALATCAQRAARDRGAWTALAAIFAALSLDEAIELHEHLGGLVRGRGVLFFSWVIPAAIAVGVLGLAFLGFLARLEAIDRRRFVVAASLYVGGALLMELPLGWWTERHGDDGLVYAMIDWVEETLELVGATFFLLALRARLGRT